MTVCQRITCIVATLATLCLYGALSNAAAAEKIQVMATISMVGDIAERVGGDRVNVSVLVGAGIDPHVYSPTRNDVAAMMKSDIIFYSGLMLEGKMSDTLIRLASARPVYAVTQLLDPATLLAPEDFGGHVDPHVWGDPQAWALTADVIGAKLSELDPDGAATYAANTAQTKAAIMAVDTYAAKVLASVPQDARVLITAHDAFNYFARRFNYEVIGVQGMSTESEAGVRDIERLVDVLVKRKIQAVFVESTVSDKNVKALIEGAAAQGHKVVIGGELFSDAMGLAGTYEGTYVGMVDHNATTIARALGGTAPEAGLHGKLGHSPK